MGSGRVVVVPHEDAARLLGGAPAGLRLVWWDGTGPLPAEAHEAEVYVPAPFGDREPLLAALEAMPSLRLLQLLNHGYEWTAGRVPAGVVLCTGRGASTRSSAEWACAAVLAMVRELPDFAGLRTWRHRRTGTLDGATVLLLGYGAIGAAVEAGLSSFGCSFVRVAARARDGVQPVEALPALLPRADVVVVAVPLLERTRRLVDAPFLAALPDGALLVNVARGGVVDTAALLAELATGRLRAALDVTDPEPLPDGHPLWDAPGLLLTPHVAGSVPSFERRAYEMLRGQLDRWVAGAPLDNVVDP